MSSCFWTVECGKLCILKSKLPLGVSLWLLVSQRVSPYYSLSLLGEEQHVVLQCRIKMCTSRMALTCSKVQKSFTPLCKKLSHVRIDQCEEDIILDRNIDARSSNFTAPSSSLFTDSSCRSNLIINFDTSRQLWSKVPGSTSSHFRSWYGIDTGDNVEFDVCCGLAFATGFPSDIFVAYLLIPSTIPTTSKFCRQIEIRPWFQLRNVLDDSRQPHPELDRSSCFHESILSFEMIDHFEARCTRHDPLSLSSSVSSNVVRYCHVSTVFQFCPVPHRRASWNTDPSPRSLWYLHWSRVWSIEDVLEGLRISARIHATDFPVLLHRSEKFDLLSTVLGWNLVGRRPHVVPQTFDLDQPTLF